MRRALVFTLMLLCGCGASTAVMNEPLTAVIARLDRLYPPPETLTYPQRQAHPAYHGGAAAYDIHVERQPAADGRSHRLIILNEEKFYERRTTIDLTALDSTRTRVVINSYDWDYFRPFSKESRDHAYQSARLREIRRSRSP
jgi:hypothetical protein